MFLVFKELQRFVRSFLYPSPNEIGQDVFLNYLFSCALRMCLCSLSLRLNVSLIHDAYTPDAGMNLSNSLFTMMALKRLIEKNVYTGLISPKTMVSGNEGICSMKLCQHLVCERAEYVVVNYQHV